MPTLEKLRMVGETYHNGRRCSGWTHAFISGESEPRYYPEHFSPGVIMAALIREGIDCTAIEFLFKHGHEQDECPINCPQRS